MKREWRQPTTMANTRAWFTDREPRAISELLLRAKNMVERRHRLTWMSEGSMCYHLTGKRHDGTDCPSVTGCKDERKMHQDFIRWLEARPD